MEISKVRLFTGRIKSIRLMSKNETLGLDPKSIKDIPTMIQYLMGRFEGAEHWFIFDEELFCARCWSFMLSGNVAMQIRNDLGLWESYGFDSQKGYEKSIKEKDERTPAYLLMKEYGSHPDEMSYELLRMVHRVMRMTLKVNNYLLLAKYISKYCENNRHKKSWVEIPSYDQLPKELNHVSLKEYHNMMIKFREDNIIDIEQPEKGKQWVVNTRWNISQTQSKDGKSKV